MQIQNISSSFSVKEVQKPTFKSAYRVVYWGKETGTSGYVPVLSKKLSKFLNTKLVSVLNKPYHKIEAERENLLREKAAIELKISKLGEKIDELIGIISNKEEEKVINLLKREREYMQKDSNKVDIKIGELDLAQRIKRFIYNRDADYNTQFPKARTYNVQGGFKGNEFEPNSYLITGKDAVALESNYGKPIGIIRKKYPSELGSAELEQAKGDYWTKGFLFVKERAKAFKKKGEQVELHVKVETRRKKNGKISGYQVVDMEFFPVRGENNPFVMTDWLQK